MSHKKRANVDPKREPKKRGQASDFQGSREKKGLEAKTDGLRVFWSNLFDEYFKVYPWDLPLDQEPDPNAIPVPLPDTAEEALDQMGFNDSPEDKEHQGKAKKDLKAKIKRWFSRKRAGTMGIQGNPFFEHLSQLRRREQTSAPKHMSDYQYYMQHKEFKDAIRERFEDEYEEGESRARQIDACCRIAKEMLEDEPQDVRDRITRECDEAHARDLEAFKEDEEEDGLAVVDAEVQSQCRENFLAIVQPLLAGLHAYTGLTLNIIGGRINEDTQQFETMSANAGVVDGKDWARWDPAGYAACLKNYLKFVHAGFLESQNLVDPGASSSSAAPAPAAHGIAMNPADLVVGMNLLQMPPKEDVNMPRPAGVMNDGSQEVVMGPPPLPPLTGDADELMAFTDAPGSASATSAEVPSGKASASATGNPALAKSSSKPTKPAAKAANAKQAPAAPLPRATASIPVTSAAVESASAPPTDEDLLPPVDASGKPVNKMVLPTMWGLEGLNFAMRDELLEMSVEEREQRIKALRRMSDFDRVREMNLAFNRLVLVHLGLTQVAGFLGMKRAKTGKGRARKKQKRDGKDDPKEWGTSEEGSGSDEEEQNNSDSDDAVDRTPVKTRGKGRAPAPAPSGGGSKSAPKWAEMAKKGLLDAVTLGMRTDWKELVDFWWGLEEKSSFASFTKSHATTNRPKAVGVWVKNARKGVPSIRTSEDMEQEWWGWWKAINPGWRVGNDGVMVQDGDGDLDALRCPDTIGRVEGRRPGRHLGAGKIEWEGDTPRQHGGKPLPANVPTNAPAAPGPALPVNVPADAPAAPGPALLANVPVDAPAATDDPAQEADKGSQQAAVNVEPEPQSHAGSNNVQNAEEGGPRPRPRHLCRQGAVSVSRGGGDEGETTPM
ncbi:hypothetical protein B0H14DRAFT_3459926 [Mycena olivaceomarginata]|nr:hypothetical protein B0H14DRAFT_3459926 [Mycena olivaceomarginata]